MPTMGIITLTLKKEWFDMILSGEKKEEYRDIKPYWVRRLIGNWHQYNDKSVFYKGDYIMPFGVTAITFKNGYGKDVPQFTVEWTGLEVKEPNPNWVPVGDTGKLFFVLKLGRIISTNILKR